MNIRNSGTGKTTSISVVKPLQTTIIPMAVQYPLRMRSIRPAPKFLSLIHICTIGLIILVAIPLPGTGAWTGALVADVLDLRLRTALPAIALGVLIAGIITTTVTCGVIRVFW